MLPDARNAKSSRKPPPVAEVSADRTRAKVVARAKTAFRRQLRAAEPRLPKAQADLALTAFERAMTDVFSDLSEADGLLEREAARPRKAPASKPAKASARLRRAMSHANDVERGRFATADDMFRSLGEAAKR